MELCCDSHLQKLSSGWCKRACGSEQTAVRMWRRITVPSADPVDFPKFYLDIIYIFVSDRNVQGWLWPLPPAPI
jgi:hypothetical protein